MIIYSKIPKEYKKEIKEDRSYHISYGDIDEGDEEDYVYCHRYNRMFGGISGVRDLFRVVEPEKANKIDKIIKETENQKVPYKEDEEDEEGYLELITIPQIKELLELMKDLDKAITRVVDKNGHIYPSKLKFLQEKHPLLITSRQDSEGKVTYSLDEALWAADNTIWFLKLALKLNKEIMVG